MKILEEEYIEKRVDVQIAFFTKKSVQHRRRYKCLKITEIVAGFLIAVFCAVPMPAGHYRFVSVALSSLGLLCEGIISLYNAKEHWISYQKTAQILEREKFLYIGRSEKYAGIKDAFTLFVDSCEIIIGEEINNWEHIQSKEVKMDGGNNQKE